jgi:hypothetical protein
MHPATNFTGIFLVVGPELPANRVPGRNEKRELSMKQLAIVAFVLGGFVTSAHAQANSVTFNGNVFDAPPAYNAPAPAAMAPKATHHVKKRTSHKSSAS